jgi:hypothetical protein
MDEFLKFVVELLKHAGIAILMLIVGLLFAPERLTYWILRKLKPDLISRKHFMARVRNVFEVFLGKKAIVPPIGSSEGTVKRLATIQATLKEREILKGNLFFLDLLKNYSRMLFFAADSGGQPESTRLDLLEKSLTYLRAYSRELKDSATFKTETRDLGLATEALDKVVMDGQRYLGSTAEGEKELAAIRICLKQGVGRFDSYMAERYKATNGALDSLSQRLAEMLAAHVESDEV